MMDCRQIESVLPPFLDGECSGDTAHQVQAHLSACPACAELAAAGGIARDVLRQRADALRVAAPPGLRTRILARAREEADAPPRLGLLGRLSAVAAAAVLVLGAITTVEFIPLRPAALYAAQVALDHIRCLYAEAGTTYGREEAGLSRVVHERYGWDVRVPPPNAEAGLTLVGVRRCPLSIGPHVHLLYRLGDRPVSLYITPGLEREEREVHALGHTERLWSARGRTYALVARGLSPAELDGIERHFRATAE
jgi:anti-sigma factor (TIGR02949 family)